MKLQIVRLPPHKNGVVVGVLMAVTSAVGILLFFLVVSLTVPQTRPPGLTLLVVPPLYLIGGYLSTAIVCAIYNFLYQFIGGIEVATKAEGQNPPK